MRSPGLPLLPLPPLPLPLLPLPLPPLPPLPLPPWPLPLPPPLPPWLAAERLGDEDGVTGDDVSGPLQATVVTATAATRKERRTRDIDRRVCISLLTGDP
jgi:hypothetical protein